MPYRNEMQMYPEVAIWLRTFLSDRFPRADIDVRDTHASALNEYISRRGLHSYFESDMWQTYDIRVDVTGFIRDRGRPGLVFVECKTTPISLMHVSQLLGYSRIARPVLSYLISSVGIAEAVRALLLRYDRTDLLEYHWEKGKQPRTIILATWDEVAKHLDAGSILPPGAPGTIAG